MPRAQYVDVGGYKGEDNSFVISETAQVTVYVAEPYAGAPLTTVATIYSGPTGAATTNPFLASTGNISFWADPGSYDIYIEDTAVSPNFAPKTIRWESIPGDKGIISEMLGDGEVVTDAIGANAVTTLKIVDSAITSAKINNGTIATVDIADGAVTNSKIADGAVTTSKIDDYDITSIKLAFDSVTYDKLATDVENAFLKLFSSGNKKIKYGGHNMLTGMGGNRKTYAFDHGFGGTPDIVFVWASPIGAADTNTSQMESVICSLEALSSSQITVRLSLANGAEAAVGTFLYWLAIG